MSFKGGGRKWGGRKEEEGMRRKERNKNKLENTHRGEKERERERERVCVCVCEMRQFFSLVSNKNSAAYARKLNVAMASSHIAIFLTHSLTLFVLTVLKTKSVDILKFATHQTF